MFQRFKDTRVSVDTTRLTQREETVSHESLVHTKPMRVISREKKKKFHGTIRPRREDLWRATRFRTGERRIKNAIVHFRVVLLVSSNLHHQNLCQAKTSQTFLLSYKYRCRIEF